MISKKKILKEWFESLFKWLSSCEKIFGFDELHGYDKGRLYAYLSERYLSFGLVHIAKQTSSMEIF